jgi:diacylglycerol kinase (ATP)
VDPEGGSARRHFVNVAQAGYGAGLVRRQRRLRALGRVGTLLAAWAAIRAVPRQEASVAVAHTARTLPFVNLVVANGQFYANGSKVAPRALPDDGSLNVQVFTGDRSQVFLLTTRIYRGEHLPDPEVVEYQSPTVELETGLAVPVEADGTYLGRTPARFWVLPAALRLKL